MTGTNWKIKFSELVRSWCENEIKNVAFLPVREGGKSCSDFLGSYTSIESISNQLGVPPDSLKRFVGLWIDLNLLIESDCRVKINNNTSWQSPEVRNPHDFIDTFPPPDPDSQICVEYWKSVTSHFMKRDTLLCSLIENRSQWTFIKDSQIVEVFELYAKDSYLPKLFGKMFSFANEKTDLESLIYMSNKNLASLLDIAGGTGSFVKRARTIFPSHVKISLLESPHAVEIFKEEMLALENMGIQIYSADFTSCSSTFAPGNKFDAVHLGWILHDWDEAKCNSILTFAKEALMPSGRLFISESLLNENEMTGPASFSNVLMLSMAQGYERSLNQYQRILERNDFMITHVIRREQGRSLIEAQLK